MDDDKFKYEYGVEHIGGDVYRMHIRKEDRITGRLDVREMILSEDDMRCLADMLTLYFEEQLPDPLQPLMGLN